MAPAWLAASDLFAAMSADAQATGLCLSSSACIAPEPHVTSASSGWPSFFISSSMAPLSCFIWSIIGVICPSYERSAAWQSVSVAAPVADAR